MNAFFDLPHALAAVLREPLTALLVALLAVAAWTDWRSRRIPNPLTVAGMVLGLALNAWVAASATSGLAFSGLGLVVGLVTLLPFYALRAMGAGDVKLMAMVGAFVGPLAVVQSLAVSALLGALASVVLSARRRALGRLAGSTRDIATSMVVPGMPLWRPDPQSASLGRLPFGVCIAIGTVAVLALRQARLL